MIAGVIQAIAEDALLDRALAGDTEADTQVSARALAGSLRCQVGLLNALGRGYSAGQMSAAYYLERAEVLARLSAASGCPVERRRLAAVLDVKALELRRSGSHNASVTAHVECAIILNRLADEGDDDAASLLSSFAAAMHPDALKVADMGLRATRSVLMRPAPASPPPDEPPFILGPEWEPTRWDRVCWWFEDRWCDARGWFGNRLWDVKFWWWSVTDWIAERKGK